MELVRKFFIALLIVLISAYSYNAEQTWNPDLGKGYFEKGVESLKILNYLDALIYFSRAYSVDPKSYYGELSYLYLGKSYALYSYAFGSKKGVLAAIGYLNQYPFNYKVPRFIHTQREFIGDSYLLLQWYETAKNIYANLYGETEKPEYMIKYGYAASLGGSIEGYNYLKKLDREGVPEDYIDVYYMTMGFYNFNLGRYKLATEYMLYAMNANTYLKEDPHLLFRTGVSYYKLGDWRKALLYLELSLKKDPMRFYEDRANFYLAIINLETKNFREAYAKLKELSQEDKLFYNKLTQILFSSLWYYEGFLEVYGGKLGDYRKKLLQLGWLNVEDVYGELPVIGLYYLALKSKKINDEEIELIRTKKLTLREFIFENELFTFDRYIERAKEPLDSYLFFRREDAKFITKLYKTNEDTYLKILGNQKGVELLARSLVFLGDKRAEKVLPLVKDEGIHRFLLGQLSILQDKRDEALKHLQESISHLKGEDKLEAELLSVYLKGSPEELEKVIGKVDFRNERFSNYEPVVLVRTADLYYDNGNMEKALSFYKRVTDRATEDNNYWWSMFRIAVISESMKDNTTLKWVVKRAKEKDNIWSRAIRSLWEG
ncbi:tetratricopeptide repeat protein [Hydrogenivirga caldilitoris]|uniref:tetratricopeptide repeat protein n=1 Tax=Hydrogenivirga caldilitoris TaxID=246264 RepID=UPI000EABA3CA|nr:tetratricopeptide repeat protein [Hydrogenivirga caldilitoris]